MAGIIIDDPELDDFFAELAIREAENEAIEERHPPTRCEEDVEVEQYDGDDFIIVAGDGAAPSGQGDYRMRRSGCGLYYGEGHSHNSSFIVEGARQNAQRAEIRSAMRWALWSWAKQAYVTDSEQVGKGITSLIEGRKRKFRGHRNFWCRMERAIIAKGRENFRVYKVASHQTRQQKQEETKFQSTMRVMNEKADGLAVEGARLHSAKSKVDKRATAVQVGIDVQKMLMKIVVARAAEQRRRFGIKLDMGRNIEKAVTDHIMNSTLGDEGGDIIDDCFDVEEEDVFDHGFGVDANKREQDCEEAKQLRTQPKPVRYRIIGKRCPAQGIAGPTAHTSSSSTDNSIVELAGACEEALDLVQSSAKKEEVFPQQWWEPRYVSDKAVPPLRGFDVSKQVFNKMTWTYNYSLIDTLVWYWSRASIDDKPLPRGMEEFDTISSKYTAWVTVCIDFRYATGVRLQRNGREEDELQLGTLVKMFSAASQNIFKRAKAKVEYQTDARAYSALGLAPAQSIIGRVKLLRPLNTNMALFSMGLLRLKEKIPKSWKFDFTFSEGIRPVWTGKSDGGSAILAAEAIRHKPNHSVTVKLFSFNEEQLATLQGIKCFQTRRRMEKLFIHNAKAVSEGWCQYASLLTIGSILQCVICKASYNCGTTTTHSKTVAGGISWCRAERKCPGAEIHNG